MLTQCSKACRVTLLLLLVILFSDIGKTNEEFDFQSKGETQIVCSSKLTRTLSNICKNMFNKRIKRCIGEADEDPNAPDGGADSYSRLKTKLRNCESAGQNGADSTQNGAMLKGDKVDTGVTDFEPRKDDEGANNGGRKARNINYVMEQGVADECCVKGCLYEDLLSYCE